MIVVIFKDLEPSELAREATLDRMRSVVHRFPLLDRCKVIITLNMESSPYQDVPDMFVVKFRCRSGPYRGVILEKSASTLFGALRGLSELLSERLNRFADKDRVRRFRQAREVRKIVFDNELNFAKSGS